MDYIKTDKTLELQMLRMKLEVIAYSRIKRSLSNKKIIQRFSTYWHKRCEAHNIIPENDFLLEFVVFEKQSLLKFAPKKTYENMEQQALIALKGKGINLEEIKKLF